MINYKNINIKYTAYLSVCILIIISLTWILYIQIQKNKESDIVPWELCDYSNNVKIKWKFNGAEIGYKIEIPQINYSCDCKIESGIVYLNNKYVKNYRMFTKSWMRTDIPDKFIGVSDYSGNDRHEIYGSESFIALFITCYDDNGKIIYRDAIKSNSIGDEKAKIYQKQINDHK